MSIYVIISIKYSNILFSLILSTPHQISGINIMRTFFSSLFRLIFFFKSSLSIFFNLWRNVGLRLLVHFLPLCYCSWLFFYLLFLFYKRSVKDSQKCLIHKKIYGEKEMCIYLSRNLPQNLHINKVKQIDFYTYIYICWKMITNFNVLWKLIDFSFLIFFFFNFCVVLLSFQVWY